MKTVHIILGDMVEKMLPIIVKSYPVNLIISIGTSNLDTHLFDIKQITNYNAYSEHLTDVREIVNHLHDSIKKILLTDANENTQTQLYVCIASLKSLEGIMMNLLSQSLKITSYYLNSKDSSLIELYPLRIEHLSPLEFKVLELIYKNTSIESLRELLEISGMDVSDPIKATAKVGYIINKLARSSFVKRSKNGRSVQVEVTPQGRQHILMFSKKELKTID